MHRGTRFDLFPGIGYWQIICQLDHPPPHLDLWRDHRVVMPCSGIFRRHCCGRKCRSPCRPFLDLAVCIIGLARRGQSLRSVRFGSIQVSSLLILRSCSVYRSHWPCDPRHRSWNIPLSRVGHISSFGWFRLFDVVGAGDCTFPVLHSLLQRLCRFCHWGNYRPCLLWRRTRTIFPDGLRLSVHHTVSGTLGRWLLLSRGVRETSHNLSRLVEGTLSNVYHYDAKLGLVLTVLGSTFTPWTVPLRRRYCHRRSHVLEDCWESYLLYTAFPVSFIHLQSFWRLVRTWWCRLLHGRSRTVERPLW